MTDPSPSTTEPAKPIARWLRPAKLSVVIPAYNEVATIKDLVFVAGGRW